MADYNYSPLTDPDGMRLLLLLPAADPSAELRGSLVHTTLAVCSFDILSCYTALSYVWGDPAPIETIVIDDTNFSITGNLSAALRDIRDATRTHRIWADALCIDQANIGERNRQVPLMGQIYSCARSTIIHLGRESEAAQDMFSGHIGSQNIDLVLGDLFQRPWFTRAWVFQELVLSADPWIQVGRQRIRWREMCRLLLPLLPYASPSNSGDGAQGPEEHILRQMETVRGGRSSRDLLSILNLRAGCQASDPRDLIFAHMGMITDEEEVSKFVKVDYGSSIRDVYASVGRYALASFGLAKTARSITHISKRPQGMTHVPSWVPDWGLHAWLGDLPHGTLQDLHAGDEDFRNSVIVIPTMNPSLYNNRASGSRFPWSGPLEHIHCVSRLLPEVSEMDLRDTLMKELALMGEGPRLASEEELGGQDDSFFPQEFWTPPDQRGSSSEKALYIRYLLKEHYSLKGYGPRHGFQLPAKIAISRSGYCTRVSANARPGDFIANCPKEGYGYFPGEQIFGSSGDRRSKLLTCLFRPIQWDGGQSVEDINTHMAGHPKTIHCVLIDVLGETNMDATPLDSAMGPECIKWLVIH